MKIDLTDIISESKKVGLDLVSYTGVEQLNEDYDNLKKWQINGYAADMQYMQREPSLLCNPRMLEPDAKTILVFTVYYDRSKIPALQEGFGRVARYAWGKDYHRVIKKRLKKLCENLNSLLGGRQIKFRVFSDAVPLLERAVARRSGLGFVGKNSMLIRPRQGSYFFIAEIISNLEIRDSALKILPLKEQNCGQCVRCKEACPTNAIVDDFVIDARKCISYLTIEKKGQLNDWESAAIGEWIFGCDICQEVCPFNYKSLKSEEIPQLPEFSGENGVGGILSLKEVLSIKDNKEFLHKFAGTPLMRAGRENLIRNAAVVAGNTKSVSLVELLRKLYSLETSEVVRSAVLWSLSKLEN